MGNDGGSIPRRDELVKQKAKEKVVEKDDALNARWLVCTLSKEPLREPVVACELGNLYNKETLLRFLLDRQAFGNPLHLSHIRKMKAYFCCPITAYPLNGRYRFAYLRPCGCVFSEKALRELQGRECPSCSTSYTPDDVVPIYGDAVEVERLRVKMEVSRAAAKEEARNKRAADAEATPADAPKAKRATSSGASASAKPSSEADCFGGWRTPIRADLKSLH